MTIGTKSITRDDGWRRLTAGQARRQVTERLGGSFAQQSGTCDCSTKESAWQPLGHGEFKGASLRESMAAMAGLRPTGERAKITTVRFDY